MSSLQVGDNIAAEGATAPRVALADMEARIVFEKSFTVGSVVGQTQFDHPAALDVLTVCVLVLDNGWTLIGKSAPASAANFDADKGRLFAREDALRQLWPLEGYRLREKLWHEEK